jgi:hypothetical protein
MVQSSTTEGKFYKVILFKDAYRCDCKAHIYGGGKKCKHIHKMIHHGKEHARASTDHASWEIGQMSIELAANTLDARERARMIVNIAKAESRFNTFMRAELAMK